MGIHRDRLAASRAQKHCVASMKEVARSMGLPSDISPKMIGAQPLAFPVPPMLEEALGYRGNLRFVAFGYTARTRRFCFCDGGDDIPIDPQPWLAFLQHPLIAPHLPRHRYPSFHGEFSGRDDPASVPMMLLDREKRKAYICRRDQVLLLLMLSVPEDHQRMFVDRLLMSPGSEDYKIPPRPQTLEKLRQFLDGQFQKCC